MGCSLRCVYVRKGVMPVLRIVVDGWMGGCNACFKDCYLVKRKFKAATAKNVSSDLYKTK